MNRKYFLTTIIHAYIEAPDTPSQPCRADWAIATNLWKQRIPIETALLAIELASVRRLLRASDLVPLQPIQSLGYFRSIVIQLDQSPIEDSYAHYISNRYRQLIAKSAAKPRDSSGS